MMTDTQYVTRKTQSALRIIWFILLAPLFLAFVTSVVYAQEATPSGPSDNQVNAVAKQLYCPVCENIPLDVCPTQACAQWRALIGEKLAQGWSEEQIKDYFVAQYGDRVLASPPARGLNWLVYIIPPLVILAGAYILFRAMRAWKQALPSPTVSEAPTAEQSDEYTARLEEELRRR